MTEEQEKKAQCEKDEEYLFQKVTI